MQGIYTYIPETNYVPREYSVAAILLLLFVVLISLVSVFIIIIIIIIIIIRKYKTPAVYVEPLSNYYGLDLINSLFCKHFEK